MRQDHARRRHFSKAGETSLISILNISRKSSFSRYAVAKRRSRRSICLWSAAFSLGFGFVACFLQFIPCIVPFFFSDGIQHFGTPRHNMEWVNSKNCFGTEMMNSTFYPPCTIARNKFNTASLLLCQPFEKFLENLFTKAFVNPYNCVGVVIDNDGYVLVSLFVGCFINAYIDQIIKGACTTPCSGQFTLIALDST